MPEPRASTRLQANPTLKNNQQQKLNPTSKSKHSFQLHEEAFKFLYGRMYELRSNKKNIFQNKMLLILKKRI